MPRGKPAIDLAGRKFGLLTVLRRDGNAPGYAGRGSGEAMWLCRCECGQEVRRASSKLRRTDAAHQSCGCLPPVPLDDKTGRQYGLWTVLRRAASRGPRTYWRCLCRCGVERDVFAASLVNGVSQSCGCRVGRPG